MVTSSANQSRKRKRVTVAQVNKKVESLMAKADRRYLDIDLAGGFSHGTSVMIHKPADALAPGLNEVGEFNGGEIYQKTLHMKALFQAHDAFNKCRILVWIRPDNPDAAGAQDNSVCLTDTSVNEPLSFYNRAEAGKYHVLKDIHFLLTNEGFDPTPVIGSAQVATPHYKWVEFKVIIPKRYQKCEFGSTHFGTNQLVFTVISDSVQLSTHPFISAGFLRYTYECP